MPNFVTTASTCCGNAPFEQQLFRLLAALGQHAVADKAVADADHGRHLCDLARDRDRCGQRIRRGLVGAHDLAQLHDVGRREEVHAEHVLRTLSSPSRSRRC
jgi:hypothetical protein